MTNPSTRIWIALASVMLFMGLLLFIPAGTMEYWEAWVYLGIYLVASSLIRGYLVRKDPELLKRRVRGGPTAEKRGSQRAIMMFAAAGFVAALVVPALDHRFMWSSVPISLTIVGEALMALWFVVMFLVFRESSFTSATIEISEGQKVISTGPYSIVRHPMYAGGLLSFIGTPLALGSYWGLLALVLAVPVLLWRLLDEERFLSKSLPGYAEYCTHVRWRLLPGVF